MLLAAGRVYRLQTFWVTAPGCSGTKGAATIEQTSLPRSRSRSRDIYFSNTSQPETSGDRLWRSSRSRSHGQGIYHAGIRDPGPGRPTDNLACLGDTTEPPPEPTVHLTHRTHRTWTDGSAGSCPQMLLCMVRGWTKIGCVA